MTKFSWSTLVFLLFSWIWKQKDVVGCLAYRAFLVRISLFISKVKASRLLYWYVDFCVFSCEGFEVSMSVFNWRPRPGRVSHQRFQLSEYKSQSFLSTVSVYEDVPELPARFQNKMENCSAVRPNCSALPTNVSFHGPPAPVMPPKEVMSLLSLQETLHPIFTTVEFSALSIALIGNLLIVLTIFSNRKMRSMAHLFLLNVAIADLFFSALNIAGHATEHLLHEQALKETFCTL